MIDVDSLFLGYLLGTFVTVLVVRYTIGKMIKSIRIRFTEKD